jgi:His-Xaa-Ser system radical SAM maturase HxsC
MLLKLSAPGLRPLGKISERPFIGRICERSDYPSAARTREIFLAKGPRGGLPAGFRAYLLPGDADVRDLGDVYVVAPCHDYLAEGDVVRINPLRRTLSALYRRSSPSNSLLVTERCDNHCLMCSQPPKERDDSWIMDELLEAVPLMSADTRELGITGGEPALLGERLIQLIDTLKLHLPRTAVHVLSNGRRFADAAYANALAKVHHADLMLGIPLYSDLPEEHDYVVQARGAFDDTVRGILNLKRAGVRIELRFVIHAETYRRLPQFATFVARNLLFVDHVAFMGLELEGFAKANIDLIWIDPLDYGDELTAAARILRAAGVHTSIYNHQLCVLPPALHLSARKSISDWKNRYFDECETCAGRSACAGFFASATIRRSRGIRPIQSASRFV